MKVSKNTGIETTETSLLQQLIFRYYPYWPLLLLLVIISMGMGYLYLKYRIPIYETTATILVKDEKKGLDESKVLEALNMFGEKKIVENEMEVLHSRSIVTQVTKDLHLYASIYEQGFINRSAYVSSPVIVELKNPDGLIESPKIPFLYNGDKNEVVIDKNAYAMNIWEPSPWGVLRFSENPLYVKSPNEKHFYFSLTSVKTVAAGLQAAIEIAPSSKLSTVVDLKLADAIPQRGEAILNEVVQDYIRASIDDKNMEASNTLKFVEKRLQLMGKELDTVETDIQKFRTEKGVVDISQQSQQYLQNVGENDKKLSEMNVQLAVLDQISKYIKSKNDEPGLVPSTFGIEDPMLSQMLEKLYDSEIQYEKLKKTTAENNPILLSIRNEIDKIKPSILENINSQRRSLEAGRNNLYSNSTRYDSMLYAIPQKERRLVEISRQQGIKNSIYSFLLQKREEASLSFNAAVADSRVIDKAESSVLPIIPNKPIVYLVAFVVPFFLFAAFISMKETFNGKVLFRRDIEENTVIPVIAELTKDRSGQFLVTKGSERTLITEQFRHLRSALSSRILKEKTKKIMITSSISGEGKSFVACNLAISIAQIGKKVVLIEADMYKPKISEEFDLPNSVGMSDYLLGRKEIHNIVYSTKTHENLFVIPAGNIPDNPSELLMSQKVSKMFQYLEEMFDVILIDVAPVSPVSDAYLLSEYADTTLFVIRHAHTPNLELQRLDENPVLNRLKHVDIVFNGICKRGWGKFGPTYGYGYNNTYGYGYFEEKGKKKKIAL
jgi:tyrosine-protein kinase Etk/Wzc